MFFPDAVFSLGIDIQVDAMAAAKLYGDQVRPIRMSRKGSGELLMGIHREFIGWIGRLSAPDLSMFREVGSVIDKGTGGDVQVAIMVEVGCRLTPAIVKIVQSLPAEVGRGVIRLAGLETEVGDGDALVFHLAGASDIERDGTVAFGRQRTALTSVVEVDAGDIGVEGELHAIPVVRPIAGVGGTQRQIYF